MQSEGSVTRVLLVADDPGDALLIEKYLSSIEWTSIDLVHVRSLRAALNWLSRERTDVILADLELIDSNGIDTVRALRNTKAISVVVLTGLEDPTLGIRAVEAGADDYVAKGDKGSLAETLRYAVARGRARRDLLAVVESNVDAMVVVDEDNQVLFVNPAAELALEREAVDLLGTTFQFQVAGQCPDEIVIETASGPRTAEMRKTELRWNEKKAFLASIRDVTDRKRAEDYEKRLFHADKLASIGQLAAGVAHEVNNPAAVVAANVVLIQEQLARLKSAISYAPELERVALESCWREVNEMTADCDVAVRRISSIVRDLRVFSRIDSDEVELVNLNEIADVACNMAFNEIRHRARLVKDYNKLPDVVVDSAKMSQVLVNMLINAAQAIEEGAADENFIRVETRATEKELVVAIEDTGKGIPDADKERIFEPFFTTKSRDVGTGLGLSISAATVRKHGGELRVTSEVGRGTRFEISLPNTSHTVASPRRRVSAASENTGAARARVLIVDDERMVLRALRRMLPGNQVEIARGGREALDWLARDANFDVVVCDLMMPDVDGVAIYEAIARDFPAMMRRLVFLSGGAFTPRARAFLQDKQPLVLDKPISRDLLQGIVRRVTEDERSAVARPT